MDIYTQAYIHIKKEKSRTVMHVVYKRKIINLFKK